MTAKKKPTRPRKSAKKSAPVTPATAPAPESADEHQGGQPATHVPPLNSEGKRANE